MEETEDTTDETGSDVVVTANGEPIKILVVDDEVDLEALVLQKFRRRIRRKELVFDFAHNGQEAIDKLDEDNDISMVISDINMPVMDGLALLKQLSETKPNVRSVIVSAYGDMNNIRTAMNRGAFDFVTKPIDFTDLEITIDKTLRHLALVREALSNRDQLVALSHELDVARDMQASVLPRQFPATDRYRTHGLMVPAKEVGGDFYDFFTLGEDRIGVAIGDVSGKGIPAALFMMACRTLLRSRALEGGAPDECLGYVNDLLSEDNENCMFVTLFYGVLDTGSGVFQYCNGGHNPPRLVHKDGQVVALPTTRDVALGVLPGHTFNRDTLQLDGDDTLFFYTDGVTEAEGPGSEEFGEERLDTLLAGTDQADCDRITSLVLDRVREFAGDNPQSDDITCVVLRYNGS